MTVYFIFLLYILNCKSFFLITKKLKETPLEHSYTFLSIRKKLLIHVVNFLYINVKINQI